MARKKITLAEAVATIPLDVDIAEWLMEQGIALACNPKLSESRPSNCPMAQWLYLALGVSYRSRTTVIRALTGYAVVDRRGNREEENWPSNVVQFIKEFDEADVD